MNIHLLIEYYYDDLPERQAELDACLQCNCANEHILQIHVFVEDKTQLPFTHHKLKTITASTRMWYRGYFAYINTNVATDDIGIVANADIFFDDSLGLLKDANLDERCFALSRYEGAELHDIATSQDVWIFKPPIRDINAHFPLGMPGCDNRLIYEMRIAGINVFNPSKDIHAHHMHHTDKINYDDRDTIAEPHEGIITSHLDSLLLNISIDDEIGILRHRLETSIWNANENRSRLTDDIVTNVIGVSKTNHLLNNICLELGPRYLHIGNPMAFIAALRGNNHINSVGIFEPCDNISYFQEYLDPSQYHNVSPICALRDFTIIYLDNYNLPIKSNLLHNPFLFIVDNWNKNQGELLLG